MPGPSTLHQRQAEPAVASQLNKSERGRLRAIAAVKFPPASPTPESLKMCPHCGFNLEPEADFERDGFIFSVENCTLTYAGMPVRLSRQEFLFLHSLAISGERWVSHKALADRITFVATDATAVNRVTAAYLRNKLRQLAPFESSGKIRRGENEVLGYRWVSPIISARRAAAICERLSVLSPRQARSSLARPIGAAYADPRPRNGGSAH